MANGRNQRGSVRSALRKGARKLLRPEPGETLPKPAQKPRPVVSTPKAPIGVVEELLWNRARGWIAVGAGAAPVQVSVYLNRREITSTWVTYSPPTGRPDEDRHGWGEIWPFQIRLRDVWQYMKRTDKLSIRVDGRPLPIIGYGTFRSPKKDGMHRPIDLQEKLRHHYVFSHSGRLQLSKRYDTEWQRRVTSLYGKLRRIVKEEFGLDVFIVYGTLLGAVREGDYIGHDMDFDAAFVADSADAEGAKRLMEKVSLTLIDHGFDIETRSTALHIHDPDDPKLRIDLFHLFFEPNGELCFPYGVAGTKPFRREQWLGTKDIDFSGTTVAIPIGAEAMVETIYGAGWREPKPGFQWARDRVKSGPSGMLSEEVRHGAYWNNFYAHHHFSAPSDFCMAMLLRPDVPEVIVDLGCGEGRDARGYADAGKSVVGVDRSEIGIRNATAAAAEQQLADRVQFLRCDFTDPAATSAFFDDVFVTIGADSAMFYCRFLLQSLTEETQRDLMRQLAGRLRVGDYFAAEFRTDDDEAAKKVHEKHRRRFQNGHALTQQLEEYGFRVVDTQEGRGLAPYRGEDPDLFRVVALKELS